MHHGADYTPYEGMAVTGWPVMTLLRGKVVAEDGRIVGEKGGGKFLKRDLSPYARPLREPEAARRGPLVPDEGIRTPDLRFTKPLLYQLS